MADEVGIKIKVEADTAGATQTAQALEKVQESAKEAGKGGAEMGQDLGKGAEEAAKSLETTKGPLAAFGAGVKSGRLLTASFAQLLKGDVTGAVKSASFAIKGLGLAFKASPLGLLATGLTVAAGAWALFSNKAKDADQGAKDTDASLGKAAGSADAAGMSMGKAATEIEGVGTAAAKVKKPVDEITQAFDNAVKKAQALRRVNDELIGAAAALKIAQVDLAEANGQLSSNDATKQRIGIRAGAKDAQIANDLQTEQFTIRRSRDAINGAAASQKAAEVAAYNAKKEFEDVNQQAALTGLPTEFGAQDDFAAARSEAQRRLSLAQGGLGSATESGNDTSAIEQEIAAAEEQLALVEKTAAAYAKMVQAQKTLKTETEAATKVAETQNKNITEASNNILLKQYEKATNSIEATADQKKADNDKTKQEQDAKEKTQRDQDRDSKQDKAKSDREAKAKAAQDAKDAKDKRAATPEDKAEQKLKAKHDAIVQEAHTAAQQAASIKGKTPEAAAKIQQAANKLEQAASSGNEDKIGQALDQLGTVVEKGVNSQKQRIQSLEQTIANLKGRMRALEQSNTGTGS